VSLVKWLLVMMMMTSVADIATTEVALGKGYSEMNPLMRNQTVRITAKLLMPIGIYHFTRKASRGRRIFWSVLASSVWASMAGRNLSVMYTHPL
jgi:hypothetical protein